MGEFGRHTLLYLRFCWWAMRDSKSLKSPRKLGLDKAFELVRYLEAAT